MSIRNNTKWKRRKEKQLRWGKSSFQTVSSLRAHAWHFYNQHNVGTREKIRVTNTSASATKLPGGKKNKRLSQEITYRRRPVQCHMVRWWRQGHSKAAPSTDSGNAATILGAYRHCHALKMINKEIFLQHLDTASSWERYSRRDSKLSFYSDLSCHGYKCL